MDEILNLIESVSEGFPSSSFKLEAAIIIQENRSRNTRANLIVEHYARYNRVATLDIIESQLRLSYVCFVHLDFYTCVIFAGVTYASFVHSAPGLFLISCNL